MPRWARSGLWALSYLALGRILELVVVMMRSESANQVELFVAGGVLLVAAVVLIAVPVVLASRRVS